MGLTVRQNRTRLLKKMGLNKSSEEKPSQDSKEEAFKSRRPANAAGNKMLELIKLYRLGMKAMPGSPKQKEIQKKISTLRKELKLNEKLGKNADAGDYIDDFMKSDAPQFKGKSDKKKKDMAIAAYLDAKDKRKVEDVPTNSTANIPNPADTVMGPRKKKKSHTSSIHDKRYRKSLMGQAQPVLLKRFRDYYDAKGIGG